MGVSVASARVCRGRGSAGTLDELFEEKSRGGDVLGLRSATGFSCQGLSQADWRPLTGSVGGCWAPDAE